MPLTADMGIWSTITTWVAIIMVIDGALAFVFERSVAKLVPGLDIRVIAITEIVTGVAILAFKMAIGALY